MALDGALTLLLLETLAVILLAGALTYALRRPRLAVDVSLRGGTRHGKLYLVVTNRGGIAARGATVAVSWRRTNGAVSKAERRELGVLAPRAPLRLEMVGLHGLIEDDPEGWRDIVVEVRAKNAFATRSALELAPRAAKKEQPPAVLYTKAHTLACPESPDGKHLFERRPYLNDGVMEQWDVCRRCRHVEREPLTAEEQAIQSQIRRERFERERRRIEAEFARAERQEEPRHARDADTLPPAVAFYILELDATKATWDDVVAAHRRLALLHHPDRAAGDDAQRSVRERKMQEVNAARDRLREHFGLRAPLE